MTAKTLNEFISKVKSTSLARQNRFTVSISSATNGNGDANSLVELFCEQAALPSISFASQAVRTFGEEREAVYSRNFESITLTFLVDKQFKVKDYFDQWAGTVIDPLTRLTGYYNEYVRDMIITVQDTKDNDTYKVIIHEAYPKTISSVTLDHNSKDVMKLQVTFNYRYHENQVVVSPSDDKNPKKLFGLDLPDPYKISRQVGDYMRGSINDALNIPDLYFDNFSEFQESVNNRLSVSNALERAGFTLGKGAETNVSE